ncbi:Alpha/Beta hydrolase protein [Cladochytrium replicatum]|nr:Alpha/Beta hydrolase protein [Cladochytrium replicatum]
MNFVSVHPRLWIAGGATIALATAFIYRLRIVSSEETLKPWSRWPARTATNPSADSGIEIEIWSAQGVEIEVWIKKADKPKIGAPAIVFVHGGFHSACCFENYLKFFAARGNDCYAVSLRGHGRSTNFKGKELFYSLKDWAFDLGIVVGKLLRASPASPPVIFGHSAGGGLVQHFLTHPPANVSKFAPKICSAFVHLNAFPPNPHAHLPFTNWAWIDPLNLIISNMTFNPFHMLKSASISRRVFFSQRTPTADAEKYWQQLERVESIVVPLQYATSVIRPFCNPATVLDNCNGKIIIVGATDDVLMNNHAVNKTFVVYQGTAEKYGASAIVKRLAVPGGHCQMQEEWWEDGAKEIHAALIECLS